MSINNYTRINTSSRTRAVSNNATYLVMSNVKSTTYRSLCSTNCKQDKKCKYYVRTYKFFNAILNFPPYVSICERNIYEGMKKNKGTYTSTRVETRINKLKLRNTQSVILVLLPVQRSIRQNCNSVVVVHHVINRGIYIYYVEHVID